MSALRTWLYSNVLLPTFEHQRHAKLNARLARLREAERMSRDEVSALQEERLRGLLRHAQETSPFYRSRLAASGVDLSAKYITEQLGRIPLLTRSDIHENLDQMWSRKYKQEQLFKAYTGGTTDLPVPFYRDLEGLRDKTAVQWHLNELAGFSPGMKVMNLWGAQSDYAPNPSWRWRMYDQGLMRRHWAQTSRLDQDILESYRVMLNELKPDVLYAYPTPLTLFCEFLAESGRSFHLPQAIICTAESLPEHARTTIENTFQKKVFVHYGAREFGMIAGECNRGHLHIEPSAAFVELIPIDGSDELYDVVITDLLNYGMPLIRYQVNDCAKPAIGDCDCGLHFPRISELVGRATEVFRLPDGMLVPGVSLTGRLMNVCPAFRKVQVIQETLNDFTVRFVPGDSYRCENLDELKIALRKFFPQQLNWTFEPVAEIPRERSGKTRFCISRVKVTT